MSRSSARLILRVFAVTVLAVSTGVHAGCCCPSYWTAFEDHCYRFFARNSTFEDAERFCQDYTVPSRADNSSSLGHLVSIHSQEEQNFVYNYMTSSAYAGVSLRMWIGLHDKSTEGDFEWTDGTPVDVTMWHPNQPDDWQTREDCVVMPWPDVILSSDRSWNDGTCHSVLPYIMCKLPIGY